MATDWAALLDAGDFPGASAAWQRAFAAAITSMQATWALAEIEERWGDWLFFNGEDGAAAHFQATWKALMPQGVQFTSMEESDRRMEAYGRVTNKMYAVGPDGKAREGNSAQPHPNSALTKPPARPEPEPEVEPEPPKVIKATAKQPINMAELFQGGDHWIFCELGGLWRNAGDELAGANAESARVAYGWSIHFFELYNKEWTAHLPASRWDSDGGQEMMEIQQLMDALDGKTANDALPEWVDALLAGQWGRAQAELAAQVEKAAEGAALEMAAHDATVLAQFKALAKLVELASRAAGAKTRAEA